MSKVINIFGSTGSIGTQALEIISKFPERFSIKILCGGKNYRLLAEQSIKCNPKYILIDATHLQDLKNLLPNNKNIYSTNDFKLMLENVDITLMAINGFQAMPFCLEVIKYSKILALANKESIVCGGELLLNYAKQYKTRIIPVDSEHNTIFQLLENIEPQNIEKIIITASGGPFLGMSKSELFSITPMQAANHPKWKMGVKISIDSATLANKALELFEAFYLFGVGGEKLEAIIHPQSIIHAIVQKTDGFSLTGMAYPDMKLHISHALFYPEISKFPLGSLQLQKLEFFSTDLIPFPFIKIAYEIIKNAPHKAIVFNAANEIAVEFFVKGKITFLEIGGFVERIINRHDNKKPQSIEEIIEQDLEVRRLFFDI